MRARHLNFTPPHRGTSARQGRTPRRWLGAGALLCLALVALPACGTDDTAAAGPALAQSDGSAAADGALSGDGTAVDSGAGVVDAGVTDAGVTDTGLVDGGLGDIAKDDTWVWQDTQTGGDAGAPSATPLALTVSPPAATLAIGGQVALAVTAKLDDGTSADVSATVTWTSSAPAAVQVNGSGVAVAVSAGSATVTAKLGSLSASAVITVSPVAMTALAVSPATATLSVGATEPLTAIATFEGGGTENVTASATWTSDDPTVAKVSAQGVVEAVAAGKTTVRAQVGKLVAKAEVTVTAAALKGISLTPPDATLLVGGSVQLVLTAIYQDDSVANVSQAALWASSAPGTAQVSATGLVTASAPGVSVISATYGGFQASRPVTVSAKKLVSVAVTPAKSALAAGNTTSLKAVGTFDDGSTLDLTSSALWTSSDSARVSVSNAPGTAGNATALSAGVATVTAAFKGVSGSATVSVTAATLTQLSVSPATATVPLGLSVGLKALGTYSDGKILDVTSQAVWTSTPAGVVTVANGAEAGTVTGQATGAATVTATVGALSAQAKVNVLASVLTSITLSPAKVTLDVATTKPLTATGTWSDGTTQDVSQSASWSSGKDSVASVSNAKGSQGLIQGVSPGQTTVTAAIGGVKGVASVTVAAPTLSKLTIGPTDPTRKAGQSVQFWVVAEFSNGASANVTQQAKWSTSNPAVATVNTAGFNIAVAQAKAKGSAVITATFGGKSASSTFTVTTPEIASLQITPAAWTVAAGMPMQFQAVAIFTDNTTQNVTFQSQWSSDNTQIAQIGNKGPGPGGPPNKGRVQTKQPGVVTLTATYQGNKASAKLTVSSAQAQSVLLFPGKHTCSKGQFRNFQASLLFSDGTSQNVNQAATWLSSDSKIAAALNGQGQKGIVQCLAPGDVTISAAVGGYKGSAALEVKQAEVTGLAIQPQVWSLALGMSVKFDVSAVFDDGTTQNVTWQSTLISSDPSVATVYNGGGTAGWTQTLKPGTVTITATWGGKSVQAQLTVKSATVKEIQVTPTQPVVAPGTYVKLSAVAVMTDNTTQQITGACSWVSDKPLVATVFNGAQGNPQANQNKGLVQTLAPGQAKISATWGGKTGSTVVTVQKSAIKEIQITPFAPTLPVGFVTPLQATALFTDLSTQNLTNQSSWVSSDPTVAAVASVGPTAGWVTPLKKGTATITVTANGKSGTVKVTVTDQKLTAVSVTAAKTTLAVQQTLPLQAVGTFSGGLKLDITRYATWLTSDFGVAGVSNAWGSWGQVKGLSAGSVTITATRDGVQGTLGMTVQ